MEPAIQIGSQPLNTPELIQKMMQHRLLPKLVQEIVVDRLIEDVACDPQVAYEGYCSKNRLLTEEQKQSWQQQQQLSPELMMAEAVREYRLDRFKENKWGEQIQSCFLQRKSQLDRVVYSLIRTQDASLAQELYFRLRDDGAAFAELAQQHSQGNEAQTGGMVGPVELSVPHPTLAKLLQISRQHQLWAPTKIGDWFVIVRFEKLVPAQLDQAMRQRLLNEQFQAFLKQEMQANPVKFLSAPTSQSTASVASEPESNIASSKVADTELSNLP